MAPTTSSSAPDGSLVLHRSRHLQSRRIPTRATSSRSRPTARRASSSPSPSRCFPNGLAVEADGSVVWDESYTGHVAPPAPERQDRGSRPHARRQSDPRRHEDRRRRPALRHRSGRRAASMSSQPNGKVDDFIKVGGAPTNCAFSGETLWVTDATRACRQHRAQSRRAAVAADHPRRRRADRGRQHRRRAMTWPSGSLSRHFAPGQGGARDRRRIGHRAGDRADAGRSRRRRRRARLDARRRRQGRRRRSRRSAGGRSPSPATPATRRPSSTPSPRRATGSGRSTSRSPAPACSAAAARCSTPASPISNR